MGDAAASSQAWAIVLAGGSGTRLSSLTADGTGEAVPKQFCSVDGRTTLLEQTIQRASTVVGRENVTAIVAHAHRRYWHPLLQDLSAENIVVQPSNRGTAIGILLPTLRIAVRDPDARILILPSDHYVADEPVLVRAMRRTLSDIRACPQGVALLGIEAEEADPELGYIVSDGGHHGGLRRVRRFVEKPTLQEARQLIRRDALWNSFILVCRAQNLIELIAQRFPDVVRKLDSMDARDETGLRLLYQDLPAVDFSHDIATGQEHLLAVMPVPRCGWSDLGTPHRLAQTLALRSDDATQCAVTRSQPSYSGIDLSERLAQMHPALLQARPGMR